ncbi:thioredoxin family protein [Fusibacter bizertensis]|uniref:Thioredoxin family protein n=1 Tax=Fusibacter bizertensis TaxID=1488331 RepID=A0ABT6NC58_9FIRM|nr:thioredoxin family protein [Fusibacter bizertensis]MDH8678008.1 thioredoxin family protein [Fusibacter bizertensis]
MRRMNMSLLNEQIQGQLKEIFADMKKEITLAVFTKKEGCETCADTIAFMQEIEALSDKIHLEEIDFDTNAERAAAYNVQMVPSIVMLNDQKEYLGVKFNGIPAGHEINSFIPAIVEVSGAGESLPENFMEKINALEKPVNIKVFVTLSCPHCAGAVQKAHKLALESPMIDAEMVEAQTFFELSDKFNVSSVPKIVINDQYEFVGNQPLEVFLEEIAKTQ